MTGTKGGGRKAAKTRKSRFGKDAFKVIGAKGGKVTARKYFGKK